jgi:hypothetical protein
MNEKPPTPWFLSKGGVLIMLFLVLGPFGLPFLYRSREFTRNAKIFWTAAVLLYTALCAAVLVIMVIYIWHTLAPLFNTAL